MVNVNLYQYNGKNNVINKTLTQSPQTATGVLIEPFDLMHPKIKFRCTPPFTYNYLYIAELNRYYFVTNTEILNATTVLLSLQLDVLKTYCTDILNATGTIVSRETANKYINTRDNIHDIRPNFEKINFSVNNPFDENGNIIMITIKGKTD